MGRSRTEKMMNERLEHDIKVQQAPRRIEETLITSPLHLWKSVKIIL